MEADSTTPPTTPAPDSTPLDSAPPASVDSEDKALVKNVGEMMQRYAPSSIVFSRDDVRVMWRQGRDRFAFGRTLDEALANAWNEYRTT